MTYIVSSGVLNSTPTNQSASSYNIAIFWFLNIAAVRHLWILKFKFLTAVLFLETFCFITLNFVAIYLAVAKILQFLRFSSEM